MALLDASQGGAHVDQIYGLKIIAGIDSVGLVKYSVNSLLINEV